MIPVRITWLSCFAVIVSTIPYLILIAGQDPSCGECHSCADSYNYNETTKSCFACPANCKSCLDEATCTSCNDSSYLLYEGQCYNCSDFVESCEVCSFNSSGIDTCYYCSDYFGVDSSGLCVDCPSNCPYCINYVWLMVCVYCDTGFGIINNTCQACTVTNCGECDGSIDSCGSCAIGYVEGNGSCIACSDNCDECDFDWAYFNTTCTRCSSGTVLLGDECLYCPARCSECGADADSLICTACIDGHFLNASINSCDACPSGCSNCVIEADSVTCTACEFGYSLNASINICYDCRQQDSYCNTCEYNAGSFACRSCDTGYSVSHDGTSCDDCSIFDTNCASCTVPKTCECNTTGYVAVGETCVGGCYVCEGENADYLNASKCGYESSSYELDACDGGTCWSYMRTTTINATFEDMEFKRRCEPDISSCTALEKIGTCRLINGVSWECSRCCSTPACNDFSVVYPGYTLSAASPQSQTTRVVLFTCILLGMIFLSSFF